LSANTKFICASFRNRKRREVSTNTFHISQQCMYTAKSRIQNKCFNYKTKYRHLIKFHTSSLLSYLTLFSVYCTSLYTWCMLSVDFIRLESVNPNIHKFINISLVIRNTQSFPHSWLITGFVARVTWRVPIVKQELLTLT